MNEKIQVKNVDDRILSRDKFHVKSFIPVTDAFQRDLKKEAIMHENVAQQLSFLVDIDASELQLCKDIKLLIKDYSCKGKGKGINLI